MSSFKSCRKDFMTVRDFEDETERRWIKMGGRKRGVDPENFGPLPAALAVTP